MYLLFSLTALQINSVMQFNVYDNQWQSKYFHLGLVSLECIDRSDKKVEYHSIPRGFLMKLQKLATRPLQGEKPCIMGSEYVFLEILERRP